MSEEVDTSNIEAFVAGFAKMQQSTLEYLMNSTERLKDLRNAIEECGNKRDDDTLKILQYVGAVSLKGLEGCFEEYNEYKNKWLPAVTKIRETADISSSSESAKKSALNLIHLVNGMQIIINSIVDVSDQYKYIAEEANVRFEAIVQAIKNLGTQEEENKEKEVKNTEDQETSDGGEEVDTDTRSSTDSQNNTPREVVNPNESNNIDYSNGMGVRIGTASPGPRPEERAQLRRGVADQNIGISELSEELEKPQIEHREDQLKGDLRIGCAHLATAREEQNYLSHSIRNEQRIAQLRKDIRLAKAHGDELDERMFKLLTTL